MIKRTYSEADKLVQALSILLAARAGFNVSPDNIEDAKVLMIAWLASFEYQPRS